MSSDPGMHLRQVAAVAASQMAAFSIELRTINDGLPKSASRAVRGALASASERLNDASIALMKELDRPDPDPRNIALISRWGSRALALVAAIGISVATGSGQGVGAWAADRIADRSDEVSRDIGELEPCVDDALQEQAGVAVPGEIAEIDFRELAISPSGSARVAAARLTNDEAVFSTLLKDKSSEVRLRAAQRTTNLSELALLADDDDRHVRKVVLDRVRDQELLEQLAEAEHGPQRIAAASNLRNSLSLQKLAKDSEPAVRAAVASNAAAGDLLSILALDSGNEVRRQVAKNATTVEATLEVLRGDEAANVRRAARRS